MEEPRGCEVARGSHVPGLNLVEECVARMERVLLREFDAAELYFIWTSGAPDLPIVRDAMQRARNNAK